MSELYAFQEMLDPCDAFASVSVVIPVFTGCIVTPLSWVHWVLWSTLGESQNAGHNNVVGVLSKGIGYVTYGRKDASTGERWQVHGVTL